MSFIWPYALTTLISIPVLYWLYQRLLTQRAASLNLGPLSIVQNHTGNTLGRRKHIPFALFLIGLTFLLVGLARPQMVLELPRIEGTVILAFDVSSSMQADDFDPTRLEAAKAAARTFIENQPSTIRIGVVAFSNGGFVVQQPTDNPTDALAAVERLSPTGSTSLGQGIFTALSAIADEPLIIDIEAQEAGGPLTSLDSSPSSVIILLSDGENTTEPNPLDIAQIAADANIRIYPVGIGSAEGSVLELDGFNIMTQLNEEILQEIAKITNGSYYYAADTDTLEEIYQTIDLRLTIDGEETEVTALFAALGTLFFLIGGGLSMVWFGRVP